MTRNSQVSTVLHCLGGQCVGVLGYGAWLVGKVVTFLAEGCFLCMSLLHCGVCQQNLLLLLLLLHGTVLWPIFLYDDWMYNLNELDYCFELLTGLSFSQVYRMDENLTYFADVVGACERILKTPIPLSYTRYVSLLSMALSSCKKARILPVTQLSSVKTAFRFWF
jgi:Bestrophin, RFP-TM, chloride channel